jgi:hypothetical protein
LFWRAAISLRLPRLILLRPVSVDVSPSYAHIAVLFLLLFLSVLSHFCLLDACPSPLDQVGKWLVCHHMYWWLPPYCDSWSHFQLYYPLVVLQLLFIRLCLVMSLSSSCFACNRLELYPTCCLLLTIFNLFIFDCSTFASAVQSWPCNDEPFCY